MPSSRLRALTAREQRVSDFLHRRRVADALLAIAAAVLGAFGRGLVQAYCHSAPSGPVDGTSGAAYCSKVSHPYTWGLFVAVAVVSALGANWLCRRSRYSGRIALLVVLVTVIVNTVAVFSLRDVGP